MSPTIRLEDHTQASRAYEFQSNASYDRQADPGQSPAETALHEEGLTSFDKLTVDIGERPPLARSSSLEVHAPSPTPEEELESPTILASTGLDGPLITEDSSFPIQNSTARHSFSDTTSETSSFIILTPQVSSTDSKTSSAPAPPSSPWQHIRNPAGFMPSPRLVTIEEALDDQLQQPCPPLDHITRHGITSNYGGIVRSCGPPSLPASTCGSHTGERPRPPRIDAPKYPPCWTTAEGLLIVPSVPGELVMDRMEQIRSGNDEFLETTLSAHTQHGNSSSESDMTDDFETVAALSPNVTAFRKGRCPRRKRSPSYYDLDILPRQRINHVD
ncbi:hypothetical protein TSTA_101270 [Talaromyces stipitatus ATCC 10500]|uniref:Uncharacterized protein n=1 Tax=Talaromyces stipitatus (strain ATCC 10500 / CBS 375.48 / QM 6759 / NRRL 1006) TaxID=441959 RepID=B8MLW1_TALSN|nr:uncharacterized protein TSTA_101270 [Talaromyces stipitatus ATCC 10500]EED13887.1 hypothetical protein TSTA_101270 [Talaromyces stipitatus ATCC 10500]